jgi:hypothetical protein
MSFDKSLDVALFIIIACIIAYLAGRIIRSWRTKDDLFNWWD